MKTFFADEQRRHDPKSFLSSGAPKPNPEEPERIERLLAGAQAAGCAIERPSGLRAWPDRRRPHGRISRLPEAHLRALAAHRGRLGRGHPEHPPDRPRRRLSEVGGGAGRLSHDRHILPDLRRHLGRACWSAWTRGRTPPRRCWPGAASAYALCRPPGHHAFADVAGGFCFLNNSAIAAAAACAQAAGARGDPRRRPAPRQRHAGHLLRARRRADRLDPRRSRAVLSVLLGLCRRDAGEGPGLGATSTCRWRASPATTASSRRSPPPPAASRRSRRTRWWWRWGSTPIEGDPFGGLSVTTPGFARIGEAIAGLGLPTRHRAGGRLSLRCSFGQFDLVSGRFRQSPQDLTFSQLLDRAGRNVASW